MSVLNINGRKIEIPSSANVKISKDEIYIDGKKYDTKDYKEYKPYLPIFVTIEGNVRNIESTASVEVKGDVDGYIECNGDVDIKGNVKGDIDCNGDCAIIGNHEGDIDACGDVIIK